MEHIIRLKDIFKAYAGKDVVKHVSIDINKGQIYGFLGPNGAGKTTVMKMILNLVKPDEGTVEVLGETIIPGAIDYLKHIGSIIEYPTFYNHLTAYQNLKLHCEYLGYYDFSRINEMIALVELNGAANKRVDQFSLGMKQRLGIARAILTNPKLLILDEPINGLDPLGIKQMRELLLKLNREYHTTMLISSHIITEIEQIADTIGVIHEGNLLKEVSMAEIKQEAVQYIDIQVDDLKKAMSVLNSKFSGINIKAVSDDHLRIYDDQLSQSQINKILIMAGINIYEMSIKNHSLEEYFIGIINGGVKE